MTALRPVPHMEVLMPVRNGVAFLPPMLDSVLAQEGVTITLHARDDMSDDGSYIVLCDYAARFPCMHVTQGARMGIVGNVHTLLAASEARAAPYFALADQDDVWHPRK